MFAFVFTNIYWLSFVCIVDFGIAATQQVLVCSLKNVLCAFYKLPYFKLPVHPLFPQGFHNCYLR